MKTNLHSLKFLLIAMLILPTVSKAANIGDYRSNVTAAFGYWSNAANWEVLTGSGWVTAVSAPTALDGEINISSGDSVILDNAIAIDQVNVNSGGILAIFNTVNPFSVTLNDASGTDIDVFGELVLSLNATLIGNTSSTIHVNTGATMLFRFGGSMTGVNTVNDGNMTIFLANMDNSTLVNNNYIYWQGSTLTLSNNSSVTNNDSIRIVSGANTILDGTGTFTNSSTGVMHKDSLTGVATLNANITFINQGAINGFGEYSFAGAITNSGSISPGSATDAASLTVNNVLITGKTTTVNIGILSTGNVAGTNYDQLIFKAIPPTNISGVTLNVTDNAADPIGTTYTIMSVVSPATIIGTFANVNLAPTLGNLSITSTAVTVQKTSVPLPVKWGYFTALPQNNHVELTWSTLQETNTSYFSLEHSLDGYNFSSIGNVVAKGNSSISTEYSFTDTKPDLHQNNYYRIRQFDLDGKSTYSITRTVNFSSGKTTMVTATPNPVQTIMQLSIQAPNLTIALNNLNGVEVRRWRLEPGIHNVNLQDLSAGIYQLSVYDKNHKIEQQRIIKL